MKAYRFNDGHRITSKLPADEIMKRMRRLDLLRVMTENHEEGHGRDICDKAWRAYNKTDNFTGIIRLTFSEKDWLGYKLEDQYLDEEDREVIRFYTGIKED